MAWVGFRTWQAAAKEQLLKAQKEIAKWQAEAKSACAERDKARTQAQNYAVHEAALMA